MSIPIADFDITKVKFCDPETDSRGNINVPIKYIRNGKEGPVTFTLPVVRTDNNGVTTQENESGGGSHSIKIMFPRYKPIFVETTDPETGETSGYYEEPETISQLSDPNDPSSDRVEVPNTYDEATAITTILDQITNAGIDFCFANKNKLKFAGNQRIMIEAQIKKPVYRKTVSEEDDTEDMSYAPSVYFKFIESGPKGNPPNTVYTKFTGLDQKPINWRSLQNTMMYCIPTVRVERIFLGAKKNFQCKVTNAIVLETTAREEMSQDKKVLDDLLANNPGLLQSFLKSLGGLEKYKEVSREADFVKKPAEKGVEIKAQPPPTSDQINDQSEETLISKTDEKSPLEGFMKQQGVPTPRRIITKQK